MILQESVLAWAWLLFFFFGLNSHFFCSLEVGEQHREARGFCCLQRERAGMHETSSNPPRFPERTAVSLLFPSALHTKTALQFAGRLFEFHTVFDI